MICIWKSALRGGGGLGEDLEHHARQQVVQHTDGVLALVVGGDGNVQVWQRAVRVAEGNCGNVDVAGLLNSPALCCQQAGHVLWCQVECFHLQDE